MVTETSNHGHKVRRSSVFVFLITIAIMASLSLSVFSSSSSFSSILQGSGSGATKMAYAQTSSDTLDQNGIKRVDPLNQYRLSYGSEWFTFIKNFRSDGSMRMDFKNRESDSAMMAGFFRIQSSDCTNTPKEEIAAKLNGGIHTRGPDGSRTEPNEWWADTMDLGTSFDLDRGRVRWEKTHPIYSSGISPTSTQTPISGTMCSTPDRWIGYMAFKLNLDSNCDGRVDQIRLMQYIDKSGLNNGKPRNNWILTFARTFSLDEIGLKSKIQSYVEDIGQPEYRYQTIRIDGQSQSEWQSTTNPPYKFVTLKQITNIQKDDGSCTLTSSSPAATTEATTAERTTPTLEDTGDDDAATATGEEEEDTATTPSSSSANNNNNNDNDNGRRGEGIGGEEEEED